MKNIKITETKEGNGVYIMNYNRNDYKIAGNTVTEKLNNAVQSFLKSGKAITSEVAPKGEGKPR